MKRKISLSLAYIVFASIGLVYTLSWPYVSATGVNPGFWPGLLFGLMLSVAVWMLIVQIRRQGEDEEKQNDFNLKKSAPTIIWTGLYVYAFQNFGFVFPTMIFLAVEMLLFGERRWPVILIISTLLPVLMFFLFTKVFGIFLPTLIL